MGGYFSAQACADKLNVTALSTPRLTGHVPITCAACAGGGQAGGRRMAMGCCR
jgi:hypothetical protein